ncbi:MAG: DnaJ domain-containing protein [Deltaproteobacteria bacterium]
MNGGRGYGKLAGGMLGLVVGMLGLGWQGAVAGFIVGLFLGHWFDLEVGAAPELDERPIPTAAYEVDEEAQRLFAREVASVFAALVANADGPKDPNAAESALWRFLRDRLGFTQMNLDDATAELRRELAARPTLADACARCARSLPSSEHRLLVSALYELARDMGLSAGPARMLLRDGSQALGVSEEDEGAIRAQVYGGGAQGHDYDLLGLPESASDGDVRRAFRHLAGRLHPDKVAHLGQKAAELASAQFQEVRGAYDRIRAARGF